jgi:cytochrome c biogenesis protein CcmG, thiol:disulfide interchange protein DsbE
MQRRALSRVLRSIAKTPAPSGGKTTVCHAVAVRAAVIALCTLVLAAAVVAGVRQARDRADASPAAPLTLAQVSKPAAGAPPPLADLRRRANMLEAGDRTAFDAQVRALRGHPIVVNMWASWCAPCRRELPLLQRQAVKRGARVAFVGVDVTDDRDDAAKLMRDVPTPYPSFADPRSNIATGRFRARAFPTTAFFDARGRVTLHQGEFASETELAEAIERYALR